MKWDPHPFVFVLVVTGPSFNKPGDLWEKRTTFFPNKDGLSPKMQDRIDFWSRAHGVTTTVLRYNLEGNPK